MPWYMLGGFNIRLENRIFALPVVLFCDDIGATGLLLHHVQHFRMKHLSFDLHFIIDAVGIGFFCCFLCE